MRWLLSLAAIAALAGCTVGPDYHAPTMPAPKAFDGAAALLAAGDSGVDLSAWWRSFNDPTLEALIANALAGNPDLRASASRVAEAREQVTVARAGELPTLSVDADAATFNSNRPGGGPLPLPSHLELYSTGLDASWEIDLWGKARRGVEAANASVEAAEWTRRDGQVSLAAEVATDYLTLRANQARVALGQSELDRQRALFKMIAARRQTGFVTDLDVNQQSFQVATTAAQLPQLEAEARSRIHALGVLEGKLPETLTDELKPVSATLPPDPPPLPLGLPSDLLRRRPDIRAAERRLAAASAQIGVQQAGLYPKIDLLGLASFAATSTGMLFNPKSLSSVGAAMGSASLFDGGKPRAQIAAARDEYSQALLAYQSTVLRAFQETEDALAHYKADNERRAALKQASVSAGKSLAIAQDEYRTGFVTFITVLQAENSLLQSRDNLLQARAAVSSDLVALYKALGGGWS